MTKPDWQEVKAYEDITYHKSGGVARIAFNRPDVRNAFRPDTLLVRDLHTFDLPPESTEILISAP